MRKTKPVVQIKNGVPKAIFSAVHLVKNYGYRPDNVAKCARGERINHGQSQWVYLNENVHKMINEAKKGKSWERITSRTIKNYGLENKL